MATSSRLHAPESVLVSVGRLYFALDANLKLNPFREGEYRLLNYIRDAMELNVEKSSCEQVLQQERSPSRR